MAGAPSSSVPGLGIAAGSPLGGLATELGGWRWVFLVNGGALVTLLLVLHRPAAAGLPVLGVLLGAAGRRRGRP